MRGTGEFDQRLVLALLHGLEIVGKEGAHAVIDDMVDDGGDEFHARLEVMVHRPA